MITDEIKVRIGDANVTVSVEEITPERAADWLTRNTRNRSLRQRKVERFARDMTNKKWMFNGDPVRFDWDGVLVDGQHTLTAIVQSGSTQLAVVITGLDPESQNTMDDGTKRTMGDVLKITTASEAQVNTLAAVLRRTLLWERGLPGGTSVTDPTKSEMIERFERDPDGFRHSAALCHKLFGPREIRVSPAIMAACHFRFSQLDAIDADEFMYLLGRGSGVYEGTAPFAWRAKMFKGAFQDSHREDVDSTIAMTVKAWNAWRMNRPLHKLFHYVPEDTTRNTLVDTYPVPV